jgi:hypothetical protein
MDFFSLPNLMPDVQTDNIYTFLWFFNPNYTRRKKYLSICTFFWNQPPRIAHSSQITCQNIHENYNSLVYCTSWDLCSPPAYVALQIFFWRLLAPFTCAAPPSNHHKSCNHNTHFCSTAHLNPSQPNQFISLHTQNITPFWGGGLDSLLNIQGRAHNRTMPRVSRRNPMAEQNRTT